MERNITEQEKLTVSVEDAARLLGVTPRYVFILVGRGVLPSLRLGRRRLIRLEALRAFVATREAETARGAKKAEAQ